VILTAGYSNVIEHLFCFKPRCEARPQSQTPNNPKKKVKREWKYSHLSINGTPGVCHFRVNFLFFFKIELLIKYFFYI